MRLIDRNISLEEEIGLGAHWSREGVGMKESPRLEMTLKDKYESVLEERWESGGVYDSVLP